MTQLPDPLKSVRIAAPCAPRAIRRRLSRVAGAVLTALLAFTGCASGSQVGAKPSIEIEVADAAGSTNSMVGRVIDRNDFPVPGVTVVLRNETTEQIQHVISDVDGQFSIARVPPGTYTVEIQLAEVFAVRQEHLVFDGNRPSRLNATVDFEPVPMECSFTATRESRPGETTFSADRLRNVPF